MLTAVLFSILAGAMTGVGAMGVFFVRTLSAKLEDALLSSAAGIMLAASFFSLILPGISAASSLGYTKPAGVTIVIVGILFGAVLVWSLDHFAPHEHFILGRQGPDAVKLARVWLFIIAITLHNLPEGMAVGVGFAGGNSTNGMSLAFGIGLQNVPEGLAVATSLLTVGYRKTTAFTISLLTGLVEGFGGLLGASAVLVASAMMPWILGLAAGAMLFIISDEVIPETHSRGFQTLATFSLLGGFVVMMFLDATLG
jgi:ZIP family zinc transporter